jgi:thiol-disulfide isomerase/thioredoxin
VSETDLRPCPNCGFAQPGADECPRCGIVFEKYRARTVRPEARPASVVPSEPSSLARRQSPVGWLLLLLVAVAGAAWYETGRDEQYAEPPAAVTEGTGGATPAEPPRSQASAPAPTPAGFPEIEVTERVRPGYAAEPEPAQAVSRPGTPFRLGYTWLLDVSGFELASKYALEENRFVTLYVYTDWCPWCRRLDREVLSSSDVQNCLARSAKVKVNPEHGAAEKALAQRFGVTGYPSLYRYDPASGSVEKLPTWSRVSGEWERMEPTEFAAACSEWLG